MAAVMDFTETVLPGELAGDGEGTPLDWVPVMGGCGAALLTAARILIGDAATAQDHLDGCAACRNALAPVGDAERSASALAYFAPAGADTQTPHAAELGGIAA